MFLISFLSMSHCFVVCLLFRRVLYFWCRSFLMPVNLIQCRGIVGVFNNCNLPTRKSYDLFFQWILQHHFSKNDSTKILVFLLMIAIRFVIYTIRAQNVRLVHRSLLKSLYFFTTAFYVHHVWVYFITIKLSGDRKSSSTA